MSIYNMILNLNILSAIADRMERGRLSELLPCTPFSWYLPAHLSSVGAETIRLWLGSLPQACSQKYESPTSKALSGSCSIKPVNLPKRDLVLACASSQHLTTVLNLHQNFRNTPPENSLVQLRSRFENFSYSRKRFGCRKEVRPVGRCSYVSNCRRYIRCRNGLAVIKRNGGSAGEAARLKRLR